MVWAGGTSYRHVLVFQARLQNRIVARQGLFGNAHRGVTIVIVHGLPILPSCSSTLARCLARFRRHRFHARMGQQGPWGGQPPAPPPQTESLWHVAEAGAAKGPFGKAHLSRLAAELSGLVGRFRT